MVGREMTRVPMVPQALQMNPLVFMKFSEAFDAYWKNRDKDAKGSGFKPYKRWENYWMHFVDQKDISLTKTTLANLGKQTKPHWHGC